MPGVGSGLYVQLPNKNGILTLNGMIFNTTDVICGSNINLSGVMRFEGVCTLDCRGMTINCTNGSIVVGPSGSLLIKNGILNNIDTGKMLCVDNSGTFSFSNMTIIQDTTYSFTQGRIIVLDSLKMTGSTVFAYQSSAASTILSEANWYFDTGMTFSYAPSSSAKNLIIMTDATSVLAFNTTTLFSTATGLRLTKGTLQIDGTCPVVSAARVAAEAISFGDGINASNDLTISLLAESGFNITSGLVAYNNVNG